MKNYLSTKAKSLLLLLPLVYFVASTGSVKEVSGTAVDIQSQKISPKNNIPLHYAAKTSVDYEDISSVSMKSSKKESVNSPFLESKYDLTDCDACRISGGYSQISSGSTDIQFHAWTFLNGADPELSGCFGEVSGTVTFEFEIYNHQTGAQITRGSYTDNFTEGSGSTGGCTGFPYSEGPYSNQFSYPHPGGTVWVELKTIHTVGSHPSQTYEHETWGQY